MGEVKHTPTPWVVEENCVKGPHRCVARMDWEIRDAVDDANARLIAAAPELLEALRAIMRHGELANLPADRNNWGSSGKKDASKDVFAFPRHMLTDIEAAIAKAEGGAA